MSSFLLVIFLILEYGKFDIDFSLKMKEILYMEGVVINIDFQPYRNLQTVSHTLLNYDTQKYPFLPSLPFSGEGPSMHIFVMTVFMDQLSFDHLVEIYFFVSFSDKFSLLVLE